MFWNSNFNSFFPLSFLPLPPSPPHHLNHGVEHTIHQPKRCSACDQICIAFSGFFFQLAGQELSCNHWGAHESIKAIIFVRT
uniref:Uncharacterized protein n=1 Tax=Populus trichocarpa TaxID=3694 RepID=B9MTF2_POPTR